MTNRPAAHLDDLLEQLLSHSLNLPTPEAHKFLFNGPDAPLGGFYTKIELAKAAQILSEADIRDLNYIRKIRNDFAHKLIGVSFETQSVKDTCANLIGAKVGSDPLVARERFKKAVFRLIVDITLQIQKDEDK